MPAPEKGEKVLRWDACAEDRSLIHQISRRAVDLGALHGVVIDYMQIFADTLCTHRNGCPLNLLRILMSDNSDFTDDVFGITKHLNRVDGVLMMGWLPRNTLMNQ